MDLMIHTKSFEQGPQRELAEKFARHYEYAQSFLRPITPTIRFYTVDPGGDFWILDNGRNLRVRHDLPDFVSNSQCKFELNNDHVRLVDYVKDPLERNPMETWGGIEALISKGAEEKFGNGTSEFLREANTRQEYMRKEIIRRYGLEDLYIPF